MRTNSALLIALLALATACGKFQQVQDSFVALSSSNDLSLVEVRVGSIYRAGNGGGYDYLEYENTQYRLGTFSGTSGEAFTALPEGQLIQVYFKGSFVRRSGIAGAQPSVVYDVVDLESLQRK